MLSFRSHDAQPRGGTMDYTTLNRLLILLMDRFECGVLACGGDGELYHANTSARRELGRGGALHLEGNQVRSHGAAHDAWSSALREATERMRCRLVGIDDSGERLMIALLPIHVEGLGTPAAVAMMGRRTVCSPLGMEMLASKHGLTLAERRVFLALVSNHSAREIAALHGVAMATVRTQIQAVREKLGARSIDALLLRAAEVPPVSAPY